MVASPGDFVLIDGGEMSRKFSQGEAEPLASLSRFPPWPRWRTHRGAS